MLATLCLCSWLILWLQFFHLQWQSWGTLYHLRRHFCLANVSNKEKNYKSAENLMLSATKEYLCAAFKTWAGLEKLEDLPLNLPKLPNSSDFIEIRKSSLKTHWEICGWICSCWVWCSEGLDWGDRRERSAAERSTAGSASAERPAGRSAAAERSTGRSAAAERSAVRSAAGQGRAEAGSTAAERSATFTKCFCCLVDHEITSTLYLLIKYKLIIIVLICAVINLFSILPITFQRKSSLPWHYIDFMALGEIIVESQVKWQTDHWTKLNIWFVLVLQTPQKTRSMGHWNVSVKYVIFYVWVTPFVAIKLKNLKSIKT